MPNSFVVMEDLKKATKDIKVDLRERLNGYIQKIDHQFAQANYKYIIE